MPKKTAALEDNRRWCEWCQEYRNTSRGFDKHAKSCRAKYEAKVDREALHHAKRQRRGESPSGKSEVRCLQVNCRTKFQDL
jgi:hypothetical protein